MLDPGDWPHVLVDISSKPLSVSLDYLVEEANGGSNKQVHLPYFLEGLSRYVEVKAGVKYLDVTIYLHSPDTTWELAITGLVLRVASEAPGRFHRLGSLSFSSIPSFDSFR